MKHRKYFIGIVWSLALLVLAVPAIFAGGKGALKVEVSVDNTVIGGDKPVIVNLKVTNVGKGAAKILRWYTALDGVEEPLFDINVDGHRVPYIGRQYKRAAPSDKDYVILQPGRSITAVIDLSDVYDLSVSGYYAIKYAVASYDLFYKNTGVLIRQQRLDSDSAVAWVDGRESKGNGKGKPQPPPPPPSGNNSFVRCTTSQVNSIVSARAESANYSQNALDYLNGHTYGGTIPRYITWFGTATQSRYSTVGNHFGAIDDVLDSEQMTFNCGCKQNVYAYVYPAQPYQIYLCRIFWQAPTTGTDSKAGTIIHETSHFNIVAGTNDWVYGQAGAMSLANSDPAKAIDNADSHEYFAENNPFQN